MSLDQAPVGGNDFEQAGGHIWVEVSSVEICAHLANDEARPGIQKTAEFQALSQPRQESGKAIKIRQAAVHLLGAYLIRDRRHPKPAALRLGVFDALQGAG